MMSHVLLVMSQASQLPRQAGRQAGDCLRRHPEAVASQLPRYLAISLVEGIGTTTLMVSSQTRLPL